MHTFLWDIEIQKDYLILFSRQDLILIKRQRVEKKLFNLKRTVIPTVVGALGTILKNIRKGTGGTGD